MADINKPVEAAEEPRKLNFLEEIIERDLTRGEYIAEFAINATNAYDILYRKEKIHYEHENT